MQTLKIQVNKIKFKGKLFNIVSGNNLQGYPKRKTATVSLLVTNALV